jgi:hypothetical protein
MIEETNNGNVNVVILLDLKKAFDVVDHDNLKIGDTFAFFNMLG